MFTFYKSAAWRDARRACFERDQWKCRKCSGNDWLTCDHVVPRAVDQKLELELSNLQTLCLCCHRIKTREDDKKYWGIDSNGMGMIGMPNQNSEREIDALERWLSDSMEQHPWMSGLSVTQRFQVESKVKRLRKLKIEMTKCMETKPVVSER